MAKNQRMKFTRFSLRTAFLTFSVVAILLGIWTTRSVKQRKAVTALKQLGGEVVYYDDDASRLSKTMSSWLGRDFVYSVYSVDLSDTEITDEDLRHLADLRTITRLWLFGTKVTGSGFDQLLNLQNLEDLGLGSQVTNEPLRHVGQLRSLTYINFGHAKMIDDEGLQYLSLLTKLERVNLWHTGMSDDGLKIVSGLPKIRTIIAGGTKISDSGTACLRRNKTLEELVVQNTMIGDETLKNVSKIPSLKELVLTSTKITDTGLASLDECKQLTKLSISSNANITPNGRASLQLRLPTTAIR